MHADSIFTLSNGAGTAWAINGNISGAGGLMLQGWERNDAGAAIGTDGNILAAGGTNTYGGNTTITSAHLLLPADRRFPTDRA